jgi:hypothetical protein
MPSQLGFFLFLYFFHWDKIQVPVHFLQSLTLRIEFSHEEISPRVLALTIKGIAPTNLGIKCANCQFKNGIVINLMRRQLRCILGQACLVLNLLCASFFHKSIQTEPYQHGLHQVHNHIIASRKFSVLDLLI